jgi:hypothetical protein
MYKQVTGDTHANTQVMVKRTIQRHKSNYNGTKLVRRNMSVKELLRSELDKIRYEF